VSNGGFCITDVELKFRVMQTDDYVMNYVTIKKKSKAVPVTGREDP
jgi:hypothetical protein